MNTVSTSQKPTLLILMPNKHLGNLLIALPSVQQVAKHYQDHTCYMVFDASYRDIIEASFSDTRHIIYYPRKQLSASKGWRKHWLKIGFIRQLRRLKPALSLDIDGDRTSAALGYFSGATIRLGPQVGRRRIFYTRLTPVVHQPKRHRYHNYALAAQASGSPTPPPHYLPLHATQAAKSSVEQKLAQHNIDATQPIAAIHVGASRDYKQWPVQYFATVADELIQQGWQVILTGAGKNDRLRMDETLNHMQQQPHDWHQQLSIGELIALYQHANFMLGNDSGPAHLAGAAGCHVYMIFGPTEEVYWGPLSPKATVLRGPENCGPRCMRYICQHQYRCLTSLSSQQVIDTLNSKHPLPLKPSAG